MSYDCGFQKENNWFRYRAAAIIVEGAGGTLGDLKCHEVAFYFMMKSRGTKELHSDSYTCGNIKEEMHWIPIADLDKCRAFPSFLKKYLHEEHKEIVHIVTHEGAV